MKVRISLVYIDFEKVQRAKTDFFTDVHRSEGNNKRRRYPRSVEQCEREIQRLRSSLDALRPSGDGNGSDVDGRDPNSELLGVQPQGDIKMRNIITKYVKK